MTYSSSLSLVPPVWFRLSRRYDVGDDAVAMTAVKPIRPLYARAAVDIAIAGTRSYKTWNRPAYLQSVFCRLRSEGAFRLSIR
jgi:hypothetical protein